MESYRSHGSYATKLFFVIFFVVNWGNLSSKSFGQFLQWSLILHLVLVQTSQVVSLQGREMGKIIQEIHDITLNITRYQKLNLPPKKKFYATLKFQDYLDLSNHFQQGLLKKSECICGKVYHCITQTFVWLITISQTDGLAETKEGWWSNWLRVSLKKAGYSRSQIPKKSWPTIEHGKQWLSVQCSTVINAVNSAIFLDICAMMHYM